MITVFVLCHIHNKLNLVGEATFVNVFLEQPIFSTIQSMDQTKTDWANGLSPTIFNCSEDETRVLLKDCADWSVGLLVAIIDDLSLETCYRSPGNNSGYMHNLFSK